MKEEPNTKLYFDRKIARVVFEEDVEPNTKLYFDKKIARVVFEDDEERKVYWVDTTDFPSDHRHHFRHLHRRGLHFRRLHFDHLLLPIEEWLKEQGMTRVEDDMCLFAMRWL